MSSLGGSGSSSGGGGGGGGRGQRRRAARPSATAAAGDDPSHPLSDSFVNGAVMLPPGVCDDDEKALDALRAAAGGDADAEEWVDMAACLLTRGRAAPVERAIEEDIPQQYGEDLSVIYIGLMGVAAVGGNIGVLRSLIVGKGADANWRNTQGDTLLASAIRRAHEEVALFLINEAPACDLNVRGYMQRTPLVMASFNGLFGAVKALVAKGVDLDAMDGKGLTALCYAMSKKQEEIALHILEAEASWRGSLQGLSLLGIAAGSGSACLVKALVWRMRAEGVSEGEMTTHMGTAAVSAVSTSCLATLKALVEEGLDVRNVRIISGHGSGVEGSLLEAVAAVKSPELVEFLVEQGCDPLAVCEETGFMPHHLAAINGQTAVVEWLLSHFPIPVDVETLPSPVIYGGITALFLSASGGHMETVRLLIRRGADPRRRCNRHRQLPYEAARRNGHTAVAAYLRKQEAGVEAAEAAARAKQGAVAKAAADADAAVAGLLESLEEEAAREQAKKTRNQQQKKGASSGGSRSSSKGWVER